MLFRSVISIYATVDIMVVGHYCGSDGAAAMSVVNPIWPIMMFSGAILGMGGAICMTNLRGAKQYEKAETYFRTSMLAGIVLSIILLIVMLSHLDGLLIRLGANQDILQLAKDYSFWLVLALPVFLLEQILCAYLANDGAPSLVTKSAIIGGLFNIVADIYFVFDFGLGMGMSGAGLATALGQVIVTLVQLSYFKKKECRLKWKKSKTYLKDLGYIFKAGIGVAFLSSVEAITIIMYNKQIMRYGGVVELSIYSTVANFKWALESLFFGIGMATQPLVSANYGAKKYDRVRRVRSLYTHYALIIGGIVGVISFLFPTLLFEVYMSVTPEILELGKKVQRFYAIGYFVIGVNVVSSYYLDAQLKHRNSFHISMLRGLVLVALMIYVLPVYFGVDSIFWIMPIAEWITLTYTHTIIYKYPVYTREELACVKQKRAQFHTTKTV